MPNLYAQDQRAIALSQQLRFFPLAVERGEGAVLFEPGGRELIDLSAGWGAAGLGYAHPAVVDAVSAAVRMMPGISVLSGTHRYVVQLAEQLLRLTPVTGEDSCVYVGLTGSDANSAVWRSIKAYSKRPRVLSFENSYHGGMGLAQDVSGMSETGGIQTDPGLVVVPYADINAVERELALNDVAAVFVEPILSDGGLVIPPDGFLARLRELCSTHQTLLVVDEVKVGLGRTGTLFAFEHDGITPDIVTLGKSLGGGLPLSAAIGPRAILGKDAATNLLTLAGNPVSAAAGLAVLDVIESERLATSSETLGQHLALLLDRLASNHPLVVSVRNRGLVGGIELAHPDGAPASTQCAKVVYRAWQLGVVAYYVGPEGNVIELTPPLTITEAELTRAFEILDQAIRDVTDGLVRDEEIREFAGW